MGYLVVGCDLYCALVGLGLGLVCFCGVTCGLIAYLAVWYFAISVFIRCVCCLTCRFVLILFKGVVF